MPRNPSGSAASALSRAGSSRTSNAARMNLVGPDGAGQRREPVGAAAGGDDPPPGGGEGARGGFADAGGRSGDQSRLAHAVLFKFAAARGLGA